MEITCLQADLICFQSLLSLLIELKRFRLQLELLHLHIQNDAISDSPADGI